MSVLDVICRDGIQRPISEPLYKASRELHALVADVKTIEEIIGDVVANSNRMDNRAINDLQKLDYARQTIASVAAFLRALAADCQPNWTLDVRNASQCLVLSELALRLCGSSSDRSRDDGSDADAYYLFDDANNL